jgi:hypothetical protein
MLFGMPVAEKLPSAPLPNVADLRYILDIKEDRKSQGSLKRSSRSCDRLMLWCRKASRRTRSGRSGG